MAISDRIGIVWAYHRRGTTEEPVVQIARMFKDYPPLVRVQVLNDIIDVLKEERCQAIYEHNFPDINEAINHLP